MTATGHRIGSILKRSCTKMASEIPDLLRFEKTKMTCKKKQLGGRGGERGGQCIAAAHLDPTDHQSELLKLASKRNCSAAEAVTYGRAGSPSEPAGRYVAHLSAGFRGEGAQAWAGTMANRRRTLSVDLPPPAMQRDPSFLVNEDGEAHSPGQAARLSASLQPATGPSSSSALLCLKCRGAPAS